MFISYTVVPQSCSKQNWKHASGKSGRHPFQEVHIPFILHLARRGKCENEHGNAHVLPTITQGSPINYHFLPLHCTWIDLTAWLTLTGQQKHAQQTEDFKHKYTSPASHPIWKYATATSMLLFAKLTRRGTNSCEMWQRWACSSWRNNIISSINLSSYTIVITCKSIGFYMWVKFNRLTDESNWLAVEFCIPQCVIFIDFHRFSSRKIVSFWKSKSRLCSPLIFYGRIDWLIDKL